MLDVDITEILEDHAYLGAVKNNDADSAMELLDSLPAFASLTDLIVKLKDSNQLRFDVILHESIGAYLMKCFLISEYSLSKALFISDVEVYRQMRDEHARLTIARLLAAEFIIPTSLVQDPNPAKRRSVFGDRAGADGKPRKALPSRPPSSIRIAPLPSAEEQQQFTADESEATESEAPPPPAKPPVVKKSTSLLTAQSNAIGVHGYIVNEAMAKLEKGEASAALFDEIRAVVLHDLEYDAFPRFLLSPFFELYIKAKSYESRDVKIEDFRMMRVLGRGGFGTVRACSKIDTGAVYAAKMIDKRRVQGTNSLKYIMRERNLLASVQSPFVIGLNYAVEDRNNLYFMLDLMTGGDLRYQLNEQGKFAEPRAQYHAAEILLGIEHIHSKDIIFRDLKLENVLFDDKGHCKISDFGLAVVTQKPIQGYAGTPGYIAPEVILDRPYTKVSDFFSFGVMLYRMLSGRAPFEESDSTERDRDKLVLNGVVKYPSDVFSPDAISIIGRLLEKEPEKRLGARSIEEIKSHPWFKSIDWGLLEAGHIPTPFVPPTDRVNADSMQGVYETADDGKYRKVKLTPEFVQSLAPFPYKSPNAIQREITDVMIRAHQGINFEKFAPPSPPRQRRKKSSECAVM